MWKSEVQFTVYNNYCIIKQNKFIHTVYLQTIIAWKEYENLQQTNHITLKDTMFVLPNRVLLDVLTSEDGLKHWYQQSHV